MGYILQLNDNEKVEISECRNEGNITTNSGGGILSTLGKKSNGIEIRLSQCVNTGDIKGTNIAGICWKQQHHTFNLLGCRNNGKGYSADGKVNASFNGIINEGNAIVMQNCYGVAEVRHPVTTAKLLETSANNFYFVNGPATGDPIYMEATGIENKENPPEQAVDL